MIYIAESGVKHQKSNQNQSYLRHHICGVIGSMLDLSMVDRLFELQSSQTKDCEIDIYCFSGKLKALRSKSKEGLAQNRHNV